LKIGMHRKHVKRNLCVKSFAEDLDIIVGQPV